MKWLIKAFRDGHAGLAGLLLVALTAGTYLHALQNGFVNYDDPVYVYANRHVVGGFTGENIRWAFSSLEHFWHPLTWLSIMGDCQLFGLKPWGHHLTGLLLHTFSSLLLFLILRRVTGTIWRSFFVAALFGVHPLHVESVAWAAERKDVLSVCFFMLTVLAYTKYLPHQAGFQGWPSDSAAAGDLPGPGLHRPRSPLWYGLSLVFFTLGLMAKSMIVTVPVILLLLDFWPLRRVDTSAFKKCVASIQPLIQEKIPFFLLSLASGIITIIAQDQTGALQPATRLPFGYRVENAVLSCAEYLGQMVWPTRLAVFYSYPNRFSLGVILGLAFAGIAVSAFALLQARKRPYLIFGWAWYLVSVLPVIGLLQVGSQAHADRYTYLPLIGMFVLTVWGVSELANLALRRPEPQSGPHALTGLQPFHCLLPLGTATLLASALLSWRQIGFWKDSETLFRHALAVTENNEVAHVNLGTALEAKARLLLQASAKVQDPARQKAMRDQAAHLEDLATAEFEEAVRLRPVFAIAQCDLSAALFRKGRLEESIEHGRQAVQLRPDYSGAHRTLGAALGKAGYLDEALYHLQLAVQLTPDDPEARYNFGFALLNKGHTNEAKAQLREALRLRRQLPKELQHP